MASKREVVWAVSAIQELDNILEYLENNWSKTVSENFFNILNHSVELIKLNPYQFPALSKEKRFYKCVVTKHNSIFIVFRIKLLLGFCMFLIHDRIPENFHLINNISTEKFSFSF
ncbi:type II toxin-antitoxin system RelE/ParE family toxin [Salegentibacter salegens]|uniref:Plasmid stabilization system protein ParE n=1 Tax=Salegentibacter salegens TaxID=143223 RepID=A0A1M7K6J2_9FLAO|nr:type II toxin-antitoxin system RelE/ParE family toxin [Salegentibacter salegens]PRX43127.1 hypothetical protein LY58_02478 [Salegentibacter salegens]SHM60603.1 hypothetical protein SAMN05878281_1262 [Salegentibacter salegens]